MVPAIMAFVVLLLFLVFFKDHGGAKGNKVTGAASRAT
jgi:hypothetical protein